MAEPIKNAHGSFLKVEINGTIKEPINVVIMQAGMGGIGISVTLEMAMQLMDEIATTVIRAQTDEPIVVEERRDVDHPDDWLPGHLPSITNQGLQSGNPWQWAQISSGAALSDEELIKLTRSDDPEKKIYPRNNKPKYPAGWKHGKKRIY